MASGSSSEDEESDEDIDAQIHISDSITLFPNKAMTEHGNVLEGEFACEIGDIRPCAIKFAQTSDQIIRETGALMTLLCHSHVITLIQSGTFSDGMCDREYIALEKCHELNLRQLLVLRQETVPVYDVDWGLNFCMQIIDGMIFVHENLVIHKDLKPSNILLSHDLMTVKIADFGSSQEVKSPSSMVYCLNMFGTLGYRPAESFGQSYASLKSDTFSLGALFYFLLSDGASPFGSESDLWDHNVRNGVTHVSNLLVRNPVTTEHLVELMLSKDRRRRPSIWQVASHPCWNGEEVVCEFDYGLCEEENDCDVCDEESRFDESEVSELEREGEKAYLWVINNLVTKGQRDEVRYSPKEISASELEFDELICDGYYTNFYKGSWKGQLVCVEAAEFGMREYYARKLRTLKDLRHRNVIRLLAHTIDEPKCLVLELVGTEDLRSHIKNTKKYLTIKDLLDFSLQIAAVMAYMTSKNYIHGCLRTEGVLLDQRGVLKLSRFRLCHRVDENIEDYQSSLDTLRTAPEVRSSGKFSHKSDVWSYGLVLYEIFNDGRALYKDMRSDEVLGVASSKYPFRMNNPKNCPRNIYAKMVQCCEINPSKRPEFVELQAFFKKKFESVIGKDVNS